MIRLFSIDFYENLPGEKWIICFNEISFSNVFKLSLKN